MGIDVSTKTGIAVVERDTVIAAIELKVPAKLSGIARAQSIADAVGTNIDRAQPDVVVIEGYGFASHSLAISVEIGTLVRLKLFKRWGFEGAAMKGWVSMPKKHMEPVEKVLAAATI